MYNIDFATIIATEHSSRSVDLDAFRVRAAPVRRLPVLAGGCWRPREGLERPVAPMVPESPGKPVKWGERLRPWLVAALFVAVLAASGLGQTLFCCGIEIIGSQFTRRRRKGVE
eukprot:scaffold434_cov186-Pinguiococcus_pyrenoidosus.AAC.124